jgi:trehalose 6-phosphate synthase/phosphatase
MCSEFTGCGRVLVGAIPVNPWQQPQLVEAIHSALEMHGPEKLRRHIANMEVRLELR